MALDKETFPVFRNLGDGEFEDITERSGIAWVSIPMAGYSPTIADFDNDGRTGEHKFLLTDVLWYNIRRAGLHE